MALFGGAKNDMQTEMQNSCISACIKICPENGREKLLEMDAKMEMKN